MTPLILILVIVAFLAAAALTAWLPASGMMVAAYGGPKIRVVVIGGGFGGVFTAKALEKRLRGRPDVQITIISRENYFVFQPMLPEIVSGGIGILDTISPLRRLLRHTSVQVRDVESIDLAGKRVVTAPGARPHAHILPFDHLVLAPGTVTDFRGLTGLPEHALPFKTLNDALEIRNRVIHALEEADIESDDAELRGQLLTFVVAGGGFSGVEVVAELNDFVREVAGLYPNIDPAEIRVVLVHAGECILPEMAPKLGLFAQQLLQRRGVELKLKCRLTAATGERAVLSDGSSIGTRTLVSTIPSQPHPLVDALDVPKIRGRIKVDRTLAVEGHANVWALGDCASVPSATGDPCPPTAQHALRQANTVAHNILATIAAKPLSTFDFKGLGKMGALGRRNAVAEILGVPVSGFLAWFLWRTIYLMKLPGWGRRAKVAAAWSFDLVMPPELVQLRLAGSTGASHEHFEPGEIVFNQGDLGDRVYIVLKGSAEIIQHADEGERCLATVGTGEVFGEMALLANSARSATVRCKESMNVLCIPKRQFSLLAANLPGLRRNFEDVAKTRTVA